MLETCKKAFSLFTAHERKQGIFVLLMVLVMVQIETLGVASIMPFLAVLGNPEVVESNQLLNGLYNYYNFNSVDEFLKTLGIIVCLIVVLSSAFRITTIYIINRYTHMRQHSISVRLLETYLRQPYSFFLNRHTADMSTGILSEVQQLINHIVKPSIDVIAHSFLVFFLIILLVLNDPVVAFIVGLVIACCYGLIFLYIQGKLRKIGKHSARANKERFTASGEALAGIKDIKLLGCEQFYKTRFSRASEVYVKHLATNATLAQLPKYLIEAIAFSAIITLALVLKTQNDNFGDVLPILGLYAYAGLKILPASQVIYAGLSRLRFGAAIADNLYRDLHQGQQSIEFNKQPKKCTPVESYIELDKISYVYPGASNPSLSSIGFRISQGTSIGLVGGTGAGKTTLVDIILGLLSPTQGELSIDGQVVNNENLRNWQNNLGYVPQNIILLDTTIAENIALGKAKSDIDMQAIEHCARLAQIHEYIVDELSDGYDTEVGERGVRLSGGQIQRIGIARALYHNPDVLVFDEATSALDSITEASLMKAIHGLSHKKTIIIIAHRLSTVINCDRIFVLEQGKIIDSGTYDELIALSPSFIKMTQSNE